MTRYLVERRFPEGLTIPLAENGVSTLREIVARNSEHNVTWLHSYVSDDRKTTYCICEGPSPEAIRAAARHNEWPVERITRVSVLDPYPYR
jgi:hypothetical protein